MGNFLTLLPKALNRQSFATSFQVVGYDPEWDWSFLSYANLPHTLLRNDAPPEYRINYGTGKEKPGY